MAGDADIAISHTAFETLWLDPRHCVGVVIRNMALHFWVVLGVTRNKICGAVFDHKCVLKCLLTNDKPCLLF